jgi:Membrane dipeptidase (Peptidase family M19)
MDAVTHEVSTQTWVRIVTSMHDAPAANSEGDVALIHCVEGGFALGADKDEIAPTSESCAGGRRLHHARTPILSRHRDQRSLASVPLRSYARMLFARPRGLGLSALGEAAVEAMVDQRILIDVTHMSRPALDDTFSLLEKRERENRVPVIASTVHACSTSAHAVWTTTRCEIARRNGVNGLIASAHHMCRSKDRTPSTIDDSLDVVCEHVNRIYETTRSYDYVAIGSDIKPALYGLGDARGPGRLEQELVARYGEGNARKICRKR